MDKKVTIVIPTYNGAKYIAKTIESCVQQSHKNLSIIVINDKSNDNTLDIVKQYKNVVTIIDNKEKMGLPKNINSVMLDDDSDFFIC